MITEAAGADVSALPPETEAAVRILARQAAYGFLPFMRYYRCGDGIISVMDGSAVIAGAVDPEEAAIFLRMDPLVKTVRGDAGIIKNMAEILGIEFTSGVVMRFVGKDASFDKGGAPKGRRIVEGRDPFYDNPQSPTVTAPLLKEPFVDFNQIHSAIGSTRPSSDIVTRPPLLDIYPFLSHIFEAFPPFNAWYADVSHRRRRGLCRSAGVAADGQIVSSAMTVAETADAAIIGAVATHPEHRNRGYASACVTALAAELREEGKRVFIAPKNENARRLYARIGFEVCGEWGEIEL